MIGRLSSTIESMITQMKSAEDCDLAWAAIELMTVKRRESRQVRVSHQVNDWLNSVTTEIQEKIKSGLIQKQLNVKYNWNLEVRFLDNTVRERLMKLMGTDTVRILDREFMSTLATKLSEKKWETVQERIKEREQCELNREKQLVLDGKVPLKDAPPGYAEHPYFVIISQVIEEVVRRKAKIEANKERQRTANLLDYSSFQEARTDPEDNIFDADLLTDDFRSGDSDSDENDDSGGSFDGQKETGEDAEAGDLDYDLTRYEAPKVKHLRKAKNVEEMYRLADEIYFKL